MEIVIGMIVVTGLCILAALLGEVAGKKNNDFGGFGVAIFFWIFYVRE